MSGAEIGLTIALVLLYLLVLLLLGRVSSLSTKLDQLNPATLAGAEPVQVAFQAVAAQFQRQHEWLQAITDHINSDSNVSSTKLH